MKDRTCTACNINKPLSEFSKHSKNSKYYRSWCKKCASNHSKKYNKENYSKVSKRLKEHRQNNKEQYKIIDQNSRAKKYGLTLNGLKKMEKDQKNLCEICGKSEIRKNQYGVTSLSIDHNHNTNKVRGLLCTICNQALGFLHVDNFGVLNLESATRYIKKYATDNR